MVRCQVLLFGSSKAIRFISCWALAVVLVGIMVAQETGAPSNISQTQTVIPAAKITTPDATSQPESNPNLLKLGAGDLVEVSVYGVPELSTKARVSAAGDLYLPLIDYVHVGDLTQEEAQRLIEKRLADGGFVNNPHVTILVDEYASQGVTLLGEVSRPGIYPVLGDRRLYDLISAAGGFTEKAGRTVSITHRDKPANPVTVQLPSNLAENNEGNVQVAPGDTVLVARAGIIYVVGDVQRPSGFMIEDNRLTVLKALALAGGTNRTASMNNSRLLRTTANGVQEIPVPLKKILQAKAHDEVMQKGDILFIPSSTAKTVAYKGTEAITSMATALAVIAVQ
jgi:polysaccharide export outer membrane protein